MKKVLLSAFQLLSFSAFSFAGLTIGGAASNPFLSNHTARVDPSGNDSTGTIGDLAKPFSTVQAALTAMENAAVSPSILVCELGTVPTDLTTSLTDIVFKSNGPFEFNPIFHTLTLTNSGNIRLAFVDFFASKLNLPNTIIANCSSLLVQFSNSEIWGIGNSGGSVNMVADVGTAWVGDVTANGRIDIAGRFVIEGTISAPGFDIYLHNNSRYLIDDSGVDTELPTINSAASNVWATGTLIQAVTAAGILHLKDSRVIGTNNATSTVYADVLLKMSDFNGNILPTSDPHVAGKLWNNSGILTISSG